MITGDMIIDYEMASPDEWLEYYSDLGKEPDLSELEDKLVQEKKE